MLTQGWRRYKWSAKTLTEGETSHPILKNSNEGVIVGKIEGSNNVMFFSPDNPQFQEFLEVPNSNEFEITPADLLKANGSYVYVKLLGSEDKIKRAKTQLANPFKTIDSLMNYKSLSYPLYQISFVMPYIFHILVYGKESNIGYHGIFIGA
jgi:hypothetical protein